MKCVVFCVFYDLLLASEFSNVSPQNAGYTISGSLYFKILEVRYCSHVSGSEAPVQFPRILGESCPPMARLPLRSRETSITTLFWEFHGICEVVEISTLRKTTQGDRLTLRESF